jgi:hypothetical protein
MRFFGKFLKMAFYACRRPGVVWEADVMSRSGIDGGLPSPLGGNEERDARHHRNAAVNGPTNLTGHEAARQNVDAL